MQERYHENEAYAPARVLNLVVIADKEWRGEIQNRLDNVGRYHASRTILCSVDPGRTSIDAWATMTGEEEVKPGELVVCHEQVVLDVGPEHLAHLETIVDPILEHWEATPGPIPQYPAGSGGPEEADDLLASGHHWRAI